MFLHKDRAMALAWVLLQIWAPRIRKDLGIEEFPTTIRAQNPENLNAEGMLFSTYVYSILTGDKISDMPERIEIYIGTMMDHCSIKGWALESVFIKAFKVALAHELRHVWQMRSGFQSSARLYGISLMPYEWRDEEIDAREYSKRWM